MRNLSAAAAAHDPATGRDRGLLPDLSLALASFDAANAEDPRRHGEEPLALAQGRLASAWISRLVDGPTPALQLAARGHHLRRWQIARSGFPAGRAGYLRWRRANKAHQISEAGDILRDLGWTQATIARVGELLSRHGLGSDPEVQALEDAACLAFVETELDDLAERLGHEHTVAVVAKTLPKMSREAVGLAGQLRVSDASRAVLADALAVHTA